MARINVSLQRPTANFAALPAINGNSITTPTANALNITGDIDIMTLAAPNAVVPGANATFLSKYNAGTSNRAYELAVSSTGFPQTTLSLAGTVAVSATCSVRLPDDFVGGRWIRTTWRQSDGRVQWFVAPFTLEEPASWTQLGADGAIAIASIFQSNTSLIVGGRDGGNNQKFFGKFWRAILKSGIGGTIVFDARFFQQPAGTTSFTESSVNAATVTINQSGLPAAAIIGRSANAASRLSIAAPRILV